MPGILGKKIGMTRVVNEDGTMIPVTIIECAPNIITQVKTEEKYGYNAIVLGCYALKNPTKNRRFRHLGEFKCENTEGYEKENNIDVNVLSDIKTVTIMSTSKGKGFQGVIKRHNFSRGPESHGSRHHRQPGSIGACAMPGRVIKGKKMAGRMGSDRTTLKNIPVVLVDAAKNLVAVKGPIPGSISTIVKLTIE